VTARNVLDAVREGRIDVGPLDAYWHLLIGHHAPQLTAGVRTLASTPLTPMPAFVAAPGLPADAVTRLRSAFVRAASRPWFRPLAEVLLIEGFAQVDREAYAMLLDWDREAQAAGFAEPA
jgi:ABC-type phosphate/phosphonate transport system substrate-binding protein